MPLPSPNQNESSKDFHSRCMGSDVMKKEYSDTKQRNAVCYSQWDKAKTKNKTEAEYAAHALPHLASRIFNTPLLITTMKLEEILGVLGPRVFLTDPSEIEKAFQLGSYSEQEKAKRLTKYQTIGRTAIINISGTLMYKGGWFSSLSGVYSYTTIRKTMAAVMDDAQIDSVVMQIDSNGGEGAGLFDLVDYLVSLRSKKPIIGISDERAFSAAYAILSTAHEVYVSRTAAVGSIGAVAIFRDISEALKKSGVKITAIYSGKHKVDYASFKPISEEAFNKVQANVDKMRDIFITTVAKNNGITEQEVRETEAAIYSGEDAVAHNLANAVIPYEGVLDYVTKKFNRKGGIYTMARETTTEGQENQEDIIAARVEETKAIMQADFDAKLATKIQETKNAANADYALKLETAITDALKVERARVEAVFGACKSANLTELAMDYILKGTSLENVNSFLLEALAAKTAATAIVTTNNPSQGELSNNPLIQDAKERAAAAKAD